MSDTGTASALPGLLSWMVKSSARHALTGLGGVMVTAGIIQQSQTAEVVDLGVSAALFLASLAWSYAEKKAITKAG